MHPAVRMQRTVVSTSRASLRVQGGEVAQSVQALREQMDGRLDKPLTYSDLVRVSQALSKGRHTQQVPTITNASALTCSEIGVRDLVRDLRRLGVTGTPLDDPNELARHRRGLTPERRLLVSRAQHRYEDALRTSLRMSLQGSLKDGRTVGESISRAHTAVSDRSGSVQRILITENSAAYNVSRQSALIVAARANPRIQQRWTELIDGNGKPLDNKVAQDSFAMHGTVVPVGQPFVIPADPRIAPVLHGRRVFYPPMRPHDRACLQPWIAHP